MHEILFESIWRIHEGKCYIGTNDQPCESFLASDGISAPVDLEEQLGALKNPEEIINRLLHVSNAWSIVYYRVLIIDVYKVKYIGRY